MEQEDQIQYPGILGIINKESCNQNSSSSSSPRKMKIFLQITLTLILPFSFVRLADRQISRILFRNIMPDDNNQSTRSTFLTSDFAYLIVFVTIVGLLSTSAVVYAAACIYAVKVISFEKMMTNIVSKVWKRVTVTFIRSFIILVAYNIVSAASIVILEYFISSSTLHDVVLTVLITVYVLGLICLTVTWHLATVVTDLLKERNGIIQALLLLQYKSNKALMIKGKMVSLASFIFASFIFVLSAIRLMIVFRVVDNYNIDHGLAGRRRIVSSGGLMSLVLMSVLMLIVQTVVYFICASYHLLADKSLMDDHNGDDVPNSLKVSKDGVQLQHV